MQYFEPVACSHHQPKSVWLGFGNMHISFSMQVSHHSIERVVKIHWAALNVPYYFRFS
jgi:hypothetical protein